MMSGLKGQNSVRACTIRCLTLGSAKHEGARHHVKIKGPGAIVIVQMSALDLLIRQTPKT